jgi:hypothetical protein
MPEGRGTEVVLSRRMRLALLLIMYASLADAEAVSRSSGVSIGPDGVNVSVPGTGQLPELTYQGGVVGFNFSLTGGRAGESAAPAPGQVRILPAAPSAPSQLSNEKDFFQGVGGPLPDQPSQRRPRVVR